MNAQTPVLLCKLPTAAPALVHYFLSLPSVLAAEVIVSAFEKLGELNDELVLTDPEASDAQFDALLNQAIALLCLSVDIDIDPLDEGDIDLTAEQSDRWDQLSAEVLAPRAVT